MHFIDDHLTQRNFVLFIIILISAIIVRKVYFNFKKTEEDADPIQEKESFWDIDFKVVFCLLLSGLLAWGLSTREDFIKCLIDTSAKLSIGVTEDKFTPNLWFNLTVFFMIASAVFTYQGLRHRKVKQDLNLNGK